MMKEDKWIEEDISEVCRNMGWEILYAGLVGSSIVGRESDRDVVVVVVGEPNRPLLFHRNDISLLVINLSWLNYDKHLEDPVGLVPSILFKSIELSRPIIGSKDKIDLPRIMVREADRINIEIKKVRYEGNDRKNYLVSLIFDRLIKVSPDLSLYSFDNVEMARKLGMTDVARKLQSIYRERLNNKKF